ncbi:AAA family ATPase [Poseidonocella sp. HB161398]|uniref:AAA family ATPase n=1 Tax=Poseidonocella sp. HB161398 TaxID=2320855 RepID=UPI001108CD7D|nr:AAA family ATPase [Poseidonocella sp. HB161398]
MLRIRSTDDPSETKGHKVLLYAHHGFGKTYQCRHFQARYGRGLIISGESGLRSVEDVSIDYVPFTSWNGKEDPDTGEYSFRGIMREIGQPGYLEKHGYNWLAIDSLTELADRLGDELEEKYRDEKNGFAMWNEYARVMMGALKWVRDLPVHVYVSCLAREDTDINDKAQYWPMVKGKQVAKQLPSIFDHVLCGVRRTDPSKDGPPTVSRYIVTDEVSGWHGKVRDPRGRVAAYEKCDDITSLLERMGMSDEEWSAFTTKLKTPETEGADA